MKRFLFKLAFVAAGALAGWLYYHFVGCASGVCPITSNPYRSAIYGAVFGFLLSVIFERPKIKKEKP